MKSTNHNDKEEKRWFRQPWFKILTFIFITPVWIGIIWCDPNEKKRIKVFAGIIGVLMICFYLLQISSPQSKEREEAYLLWSNSTPTERLHLLADNDSDEFPISHFLFGKTKEELTILLGSPDITNSNQNLVYHLSHSEEVNRQIVCTFRFENNQYSGLRIQSTSSN